MPEKKLPADAMGVAKPGRNTTPDDDKYTTKKKGSANKGLGRTRNFATCVYPDSAPEGWMQKLEDLHVPAFVGPLHDHDIDKDGTPKKPHWHVLLMFESVKTQAQADEAFAKFGGVGHETVNSLRGYARYLCHLDNPDKAQYNRDDVIELSGASYDMVTRLPSDDIGALRDMMAFIRANQVSSFADFADHCAENDDSWFELLAHSSTYFIKEYIKSLAYKSRSSSTTMSVEERMAYAAAIIGHAKDDSATKSSDATE